MKAPLLLSLSCLAALAGCSTGEGGLASAFSPSAATYVPEEALDVPYVPTPMPAVERMLDLAEVGPQDYLIDLGSGDGRIAMAAARRGARALGVDIDPYRVAEATAAARLEGLTDQVRFRRQDLFETPIGEASVVALYLLPHINLRLRPRLLTELRPGTRIVSHVFDMGDWRADVHEQVHGSNIYMWIVPAAVGGRWVMTLPGGESLSLTLEQRFQEVSGTLGPHALENVRLRGDRLSFTANGIRYQGVADGAEIRPNEAGGWRARRSSE